ncbi:MAG: helix-turn-helix domain-containing protein [Pseudomonadota bacterium]
MEILPRPNCPVARSASLLGDKWSLLILRNLILDGPHRFQDFARTLEGISPTTLSARLKALQDGGLITRDVVPTHPPKTVYTLSEAGQAAKPIIRAMREFGSTLPAKPD